MVNKHCVYKDCESDSRYWDRDFMKGICFIRFPNPLTHRQRCEKWVHACSRPDLTIDCVNDKTYICSKHFLGGNGPTKESIDPLPLKQLLEANRLSQMTNDYKSNDISSEPKIRDSLNLNFSKNESNLITNILNKTKINCPKLYESLSSNLFTSSIIKEPKTLDIDSSDNSIEFNNEFINESLLLSTIHSISPQNSNHVITNDIQTELNNKRNPEIVSNSLPFIIIPPNNQTFGSSFSVPLMQSNDNNWFKQLMDTELLQKLSQLGLSLGRSGHRLTFSSIQGSIVEKQLIVDISGHFDVKVFGLSICAKNDFYKILPNIIQDQFEFNTILGSFYKWKVCIANELTERVFEDKIITIRAFVCSITNTFRSRNCSLFLSEIGSNRCKNCRLLLNRFRKFKKSKFLNKSLIKT